MVRGKLPFNHQREANFNCFSMSSFVEYVHFFDVKKADNIWCGISEEVGLLAKFLYLSLRYFYSANDHLSMC